jgi:hypothetical protein
MTASLATSPRPALVLLALAIACGRDVDPPRPDSPTIPPEAFAVVVTELATARSELLPDTTAYRARRDAILARHGVTADQLRAFAESYGGNEDVVSAIYKKVAARIEATFGSGAIAPPSTGVAPPEETQPPVLPPAEPAPSAEPPLIAPDTSATVPPPIESITDTTAATSADTE